MLDFAISILAFIVAISVLVAVHEYGHFWVARKLGFKVLRFSIGFGRPLIRWQGNGIGMPVSLATEGSRWPLVAWLARDDGIEPVEFCISSIPLGGYVRMLGDDAGPVPEEDRDKAFHRRPVLSRIAVLFAGPGANFLFAILAYWLMFMAGIPGSRPYIDAVVPESVAAQSGLAAGDIIDSVGGRDTLTWESALVGILDALLDDGVIDLEVSAADGDRKFVSLDVRGRESELTEPEALFDGLGVRPGPRLPAVVDDVTDGSPADVAGLQSGDRLVSAGGEVVSSWDDLVTFVRARPGEVHDFSIERDGSVIDVPIGIGSADEGGQTIGRIGVGPMPFDEALIDKVRVLERHGIVGGLTAAAAKTWETSVLTLRMIGRMLTGDVSIRSASGPIMIAAYAGDFAQAGALSFLGFLSLISISLGIMNLLPIPVLDGGRIIEQVIEWAKGSPLSEKSLIVGQQIGIAMLVVLMGVVFYNDIVRLLGP